MHAGQKEQKNGPDPVRILIADTRALVRAALRSYLESQHDIEVVADTDDGADAVRLAELHAPDIVLLSPDPPTVSGATGS